MFRKGQIGFTLVELLVVIAIIGILMAIILPTIDYAREQARRAQCLNNQRQIGQGILQYATAKGHFPGRLNRIQTANSGQITTTWTGVVMPYISRADVWEAIVTTGTNPTELTIASLICPSEPKGMIADQTPISYKANAGTADSLWVKPGFTTPDDRANGVCHNLTSSHREILKVSMEYVIKHDGLASTILMGERGLATSWADTTAIREEQANLYWALTENPGIYATLNWIKTGSYHRGGINITFCDGHATFLNGEGLPYAILVKLMTPNDAGARHPTGPMTYIPDWTTAPLKESDYQ